MLVWIVKRGRFFRVVDQNDEPVEYAGFVNYNDAAEFAEEQGWTVVE